MKYYTFILFIFYNDHERALSE